MVTCGVCGDTANPGSIFCRRCGAELPRRSAPVSDAQTTVLPSVPPAPDQPRAPRHGASEPTQVSAAAETGDVPTIFDQPVADEQRTTQLPPLYQPAAGYSPQRQAPPTAYPPPPSYGAPPGSGGPYAEPPTPTPSPGRRPPERRPSRNSPNRGVILATLIGGVLALVLVAFGLAILLLSKDNSKNGVAQPAAPISTSPASSAAPTTSAPPSSASAKPTPTPTNAQLKAAQTAALKQLGGLVGQSGTARSGIQTALDQIGSCKSINQAIATLQGASSTRQSLAAAAGKLNLGSLPTGPALVASFQQSMQESSAADLGYANWGRQVRSSCKKTAKHTSAWNDAQVHDGQATAAKTTFANQYNAAAKALGQPGVTPTQF